MLLTLLAACTSHNAIVTLVPSADVVEAPAGVVPLIERQSDVAPDTEAPDRRLGSLGFSGSLAVTLSEGVHWIDASGELLSHPGCEQPTEPQSACFPSGWIGSALVEVFGPDWGPDDAETSSPVVEIAEGEVGEVVITVRPSCECDD